MAIKICEIERCVDCGRAWNMRVRNRIGDPAYIGYVDDKDVEAYEVIGTVCDWCNYG